MSRHCALQLSHFSFRCVPLKIMLKRKADGGGAAEITHGHGHGCG